MGMGQPLKYFLAYGLETGRTGDPSGRVRTGSDSDWVSADQGRRYRNLDDDIGDPEFAPVHTARRVPVYRKLGPFQTKRLREISIAFCKTLTSIDPSRDLPAGLLDRQNLATRVELAESIFPPDDSSIAEWENVPQPSPHAAVFEGVLLAFARRAASQGERRKEPKGTVIEISAKTKERLKQILPFSLTGAQKK